MRPAAAAKPGPVERALLRATREVSQAQAKELLQEMRAKAKLKEAARKNEFRRRLAMGEVVSHAGLDDWSTAEVLGLLLEGKERVGASPTMRLGMKQRGEQHTHQASARRSNASARPAETPATHQR
ncbi:MAG: hypothetical protein AMXMBFR59_12790 [Rhodanobacteraceae bacterium]